MTKRITIKDISRELKVHHSTVSRALRDDPKVRKETRERIKRYAKKHGYRTNMNALQLRGSVKNVIAVIVPNINHIFFSNIISVITNLAYKDGFIVSVFQTNESLELEKGVLNSIILNNIAGVIASVSMETTNAKHFRALKKYRIPLVMFDRVVEKIKVPKVESNNFEVVAGVVKKLNRDGCRRIAHITGPKKISVFRNRNNGYHQAIEELGLPYTYSCSPKKGFTIEAGKETAVKIFSNKIKPDAIICDSDIMMMGIIFQLKEMNIKVPEEIKLVSFGDNPVLNLLTPNVSSIIQPMTEIAEASYRLLKNAIDEKENTRPINQIFNANLIYR